jgi:hypothetical protein
MRRLGIDPDHGAGRPPLTFEQLVSRRRESGLAEALPILRSGLMSVAEEAATHHGGGRRRSCALA